MIPSHPGKTGNNNYPNFGRYIWFIMGNVKNGDTVKPAYKSPVYSGHPVCYGDRTTSQNFQLPYIFLQSYLYIAVTLYITVTLPFPKVTVVYRFDCNPTLGVQISETHAERGQQERKTTPRGVGRVRRRKNVFSNSPPSLPTVFFFFFDLRLRPSHEIGTT